MAEPPRSDAFRIKERHTNQIVPELFEPVLEPLYEDKGVCSEQKDFYDNPYKATGFGPTCHNEREVGAMHRKSCLLNGATDCIRIAYAEVERWCNYYRLVDLSNVSTGHPEGYVYANFWGPESYKQVWDTYFPKDEFEDCMKQIDEKCSCQNCKPPKPPGGGGNNNSNGDPDTTDNESPVVGSRLMTVTTGSNYGPIPRVYGNFVVAGNIIWIGNKRSRTITYVHLDDEGVPQLLTDTLTVVDFAVAIGAAPIDQMLRVWANDTLIFNITDYEAGFVGFNMAGITSASQYHMERFAYFSPKITLLNNNEHGFVPYCIANDVGLDRTPAMRDLAVVLFEDVDLLLFGGAMPELKFDVVNTLSTTEQTVVDIPPAVLSDNSVSLGTTFIHVDPLTELVFAKDVNNNIRMFDLTTLEQQYVCDTVDPTNLHVMQTGNILAQLSSALVVSPTKNIQRMEIDTTIGTHCLSFLANSTINSDTIVGSALEGDQLNRMIRDTYGYQMEFIVSLYSNGDFDIIEYDHVADYPTFIVNQPATPGYVLQHAMLEEDTTGLYLVQFLFDATTQDTLRVDKYTLRDSSGAIPAVWTITFGPFSEGFVYEPSLTTFTVGKIGWGGTNTGITLKYAIRDTRDNGIVMFFSNNFVTKINTAGTIQWQTVLTEPISTHNNHGRMLIAVNPYYYYIADNGNIVRLELSTGRCETTTSLSSLGAPAIAGVQFFDQRTNGLIYVTNDATKKLAQVYPGRLTVNKIAGSDIFESIMTTAGLEDTIDVSDMDFEVYGLLLDQIGPLASSIEPIMQVYNITIMDNGQALSFVNSANITTSTSLDLDDVGIFDTLDTQQLILNEPLQSVVTSFYQIDANGLQAYTQNVTLVPDLEEIRHEEQFDLTVYDEPLAVRLAAEQYLQLEVLGDTELKAQLLPNQIKFCPNDRIVVDDITYRISEIYIDAPLGITLTAKRHSQDILVTTASLTQATLNTGFEYVRNTKHQLERPVVLFTNAVNDADMARCVTGQVCYTGIEAPDRANPTPLRYIIKVMDEDAEITEYETESHTEGVHVGALKSTLPDMEHAWIIDRDTQLIVEFDHADTPSFITTTYSNPYDMLEDEPTENLLIVGREYIRFANYSISGRTVTFTNLLRGVQGTEIYAREHYVNEKVYFYTPTTFKRLEVNPLDTHIQPRLKCLFYKERPVGAPFIHWLRRADAGGARPWAVHDINFTFTTPPTQPNDPTTITWKRRRNFNVDHSNTLDVPEDFPLKYWVGVTLIEDGDEDAIPYLAFGNMSKMDKFFRYSLEYTHLWAETALEEFDFYDVTVTTGFIVPVKGAILGYLPYFEYLGFDALHGPTDGYYV